MRLCYQSFSILYGLLIPIIWILQVQSAETCVMRGHCGRQSVFGAQLNCPYNGTASELPHSVRRELVEVCGDDWADEPVCCNVDQTAELKANFNRIRGLIASCPACYHNFRRFFCTFTCSSHQSRFINVTRVGTSLENKMVVTEVSYYVSPQFGENFYNSCKDIKFSATNGYVMDFIGGGAKNYTQFFKFMGDRKPLGSPFQINFPASISQEFEQMNEVAHSCASKDSDYRCACIDCPSACPELEKLPEKQKCQVGLFSCVTFAIFIVYIMGLASFVAGVVGQKIWSSQDTALDLTTRSNYEIEFENQETESMLEDVLGAGYHHKLYPPNTFFSRGFNRLGFRIASKPLVWIAGSLIISGLLSLGWTRFEVEKDPAHLWISPSSEFARQKTYFDDHFGPFFRSEMAILSNKSDERSGVLTYDTLAWWFQVEKHIKFLKTDEGLSLENVCYNPTGKGCVTQSLSGYWHNFQLDEKTWKAQLRRCASHPTLCIPESGQSLERSMVLSREEPNVPPDESRAMIITWVLENGTPGSDTVSRAAAVESRIRDYLIQTVKEEADNRGLRLTFTTELSLEQELNKSSNTDSRIIIFSYAAMLIYVSLALGSSLKFSRQYLVESEIILGIAGVFIVLLSVVASIGIFSALGIKTTLIIVEVIPFFILAVGVDNIFLISYELKRMNVQHAEDSVPMRVGYALDRIGPFILLSSLNQTLTFILAAFVSMPAVRNFAIYAAGAVFINALLQMTIFTAALSLDQKRIEANRVAFFPLIKLRTVRQSTYVVPESIIAKFIKNTYAPILLTKKVKILVVTIFFALFAASFSLLPTLQLGLDQRIALPRNSYLIDYFDDLYKYIATGPPVYFVAKNANITERPHQQALCGKFSTCSEYSLTNILEQERKRSNQSYISQPVASWIDDYFQWLNPNLTECCRVQKVDQNSLCYPKQRDDECSVCFEDRQPPWNINMQSLPIGKEFIHYLNLWLEMQPSSACPLGGKAGYSNAVAIDHKLTNVIASNFRTTHTPLLSQEDYIASLKSSLRISKLFHDKSGIEVFPHSPHYIFFQQYLTIIGLAVKLLTVALIAVFINTAIFMGSLLTSLTVMLTVLMIVIDIMGVMAIWRISLNAVSLVNLIISVGIAVEFCSHIAGAFTFTDANSVALTSKKASEGDARIFLALVHVGPPVFSGITLTKLIGISVLAFTSSKIFEIYYFRMWLALILLGALHGFMFLPVILSLFGGNNYDLVAEEVIGEGWQEIASSRYSEALLANELHLSEEDD